MPRDLQKQRAWQQRDRDRRMVAKYGPDALGRNMSGRHGNHARGEKNGKWRGGRHLTSHGYVALRVPPEHPHAWGAHPTVKYAYEHIIVMEAHLGRALGDDEIVHHRNEDKRDNSIDNLEVLTVAAHMREHSERRGRDVLGRFPPADLRVREFPEVRS